MECYACDQPATNRCPRCGNSFCDAHGGGPAAGSGQGLCGECLDPVNATPTGAIFRLSLFALLGASVLALWLLVRPPSLPGESSALIQPTSNEPTATLPPSSPPPGGSPAGSSSPAASASPGPGTSPTAAAQSTPAGSIEYTVEEGDTLSSIAAAYGVSAADLAAVNGLSDADLISPGDVLVIPQ
ncbi:MAG: LysM domain-containing protein [Dehalococcoidia bacterium]|nr:LysM domain-containing protein [Dehalococcoidia bacterium]